MPTGLNVEPPGPETLVSVQREAGTVGPAPCDDRTEIRWARCGTDDVIVKAGGDALRGHLRREAEVLRRCDTDAVVQLLELVEGADHTELVTLRFGSLTLNEVGLLDLDERGTALAALCAAVDDLHASGWSHGELESSHVLIEPGGGARLCSLGGAIELAGKTTSTAVAADHDDLAVMVCDALREPAGFDSSGARRKWNRSARRAVSRLEALRGLRSGSAILEVLRDCNLPGTSLSDREPPEPDAEHRTHERAGPSRTVVLTAAAALGLGSGVIAWALSPIHAAREPADAVVADEGNRVEGRIVIADGHRYELGRDGDIPRLGDWNCDGDATVALLRPESGQVFAFDGWAEPNQPMQGELLDVIDGASDLARPTKCGPIAVVLEDGTTMTVDSSGGQP